MWFLIFVLPCFKEYYFVAKCKRYILRICKSQLAERKRKWEESDTGGKFKVLFVGFSDGRWWIFSATGALINMKILLWSGYTLLISNINTILLKTMFDKCFNFQENYLPTVWKHFLFVRTVNIILLSWKVTITRDNSSISDDDDEDGCWWRGWSHCPHSHRLLPNLPQLESPNWK